MKFKEYLMTEGERIRGVVSLSWEGSREKNPEKTIKMRGKNYEFYQAVDDNGNKSWDVRVRLDNDAGFIWLAYVNVDFDKMSEETIQNTLLNSLLNQLFKTQMYNIALDLGLLDADFKFDDSTEK